MTVRPFDDATGRDDYIPCPFAGCWRNATYWYEYPTLIDILGMPAQFRICLHHKMILHMHEWLERL